jgi:YegS/Rv2252/BmrU family lipid kinase
MRLRFIFNPRSGRPKRNAPLLPALRAFIQSRRLDADLACTEGQGHATELAKEAIAAGCRRLVAVGGDGTVNEIIQATLETPVELGLVPCGSGNGLALHLGLPTDPLASLEVATSEPGRVAQLDTGSANGLPFINTMGLGLDAEVGRRFNQLAKRGLPAYVRTALSAFFGRQVERCSIVADGRAEAIDILLIAIANTDQYGNRARIAPGARVDDGILDLIAVRPVGLAAACSLGARLFLGNLHRSSHVRRMAGARILIERPRAGIIHTDGEIHDAAATIEVCVRPRSIRVVVPAGCTAVAQDERREHAGFALQLP